MVRTTANAAPAPSLDWCLFLDIDGTLLEFTDTPFDTSWRTRAQDADGRGGASA